MKSEYFWIMEMEKTAKPLNCATSKWEIILNGHCWDFILSPGMIVLMFFTKGKAVSWKKMVKNGMFIKGLQELGLSWKIPHELFKVIEEFVCSTCGFSCSSVNKVSSKTFSKRLLQQRRPSKCSLLTIGKSVLKYHMLQAVFAAKLWQSVPTSWIEAPQITDFAWRKTSMGWWRYFPEDVTDLLPNNPDDIGMNKEFEDDDPVGDESDDEMSRYDTDGSTASNENSNDNNDFFF